MMKKSIKSSRKFLYEMTEKIDPTFKKSTLNEEYSILASYKGNEPEEVDSAEDEKEARYLENEYAIAFGPNFKIWIENGGQKIDENDSNIIVTDKYNDESKISEKEMVEIMKNKLDKIVNNPQSSDYDAIPILFNLIVDKKYKLGNKFLEEDYSDRHEKMVELMKGKIDFLYDNNRFDILQKINKIIDKIADDSMQKPESEIDENNNEKKSNYHATLSGAVDNAINMAKDKGYEIDEHTLFTEFGTGGVGYDETKSAIIPLFKNGEPQKEALSITIYRMPSGKYELTTYIN